MRITENDLMTILKYRKEPKVPKSYRLPKPLLEELKKVSEETGLTESEIIVCALEEFLNREE